MIRILMIALVLVVGCCLAPGAAEAGPLGFVRRCAGGACNAAKGVVSKTRFADGDGRPLRRAR